jgi:hypothetical protein
VRAEIRLVLKLLDEKPVGPRHQLPVQISRIVAGGVRPVFRELDEKPWYGLLCSPCQKPSTTVFARSSRLRIAMRAAGSTKFEALTAEALTV